jgi:heptose-I-phosphate ethanolaminephosphotransferase
LQLSENENAIIFFISDHGMDLYDTGEIAGHTDEKAGSRHMIEVPFIIWASQKYRTKYPETWKKMLVSVNRPYRTDELFHTILDAAGIRTTSFDPSKSIFNDKFKPIERIYSGKLYHRLDE